MTFHKMCLVFSAVLACTAALAVQVMGLNVKNWQNLYNEGARLFDKMDAKGLTSHMTRDWKSFGPEGKLRESGNELERMTKSFAGLKSMHAQFKVLSVRADRNGVVVHVSSIFSIVTKPGPDKKTHRILQKAVSNDKWVQKNGNWLMAENRIVKESNTMDGKPMPADGG